MQYRLLMTLVCMIALLCCCHQTFGIKLTYDRIEQTLGQDIAWFDLRVRKYNRTSTVINGTIHLFQEGTDDYQCHVDVYYSRLGNQQFNYMPIKLPPAGICEFVDNLYKNYASYLEMLVNAPKRGECPIAEREVHIFDSEFPTEALPQIVLRSGLWKSVFHCYLHSKEVLTYSVYIKATDS